MKPEILELIKAERRRDNFNFIAKVIQRGRKRPAKYHHNLSMPISLYEELRSHGIIDMLELEAYQDVFFEVYQDEVTISFYNLYAIEDLHRRIDYYLIMKFSGSYPIKRTGVSKL
jgi:hypothetical protein